MTIDSNSRHWYVARVGNRAEHTSCERLGKMGYEAYVASRKEIHLWRNGRKKKIDKVVISSYVFVRVTEEERRLIVNFPFIKSFVMNLSDVNKYGGHQLAVIPDDEMRRFRDFLNDAQGDVCFTSSFKLGEKVMITGWGGSDYEASIVHLPDDRTHYVGVRLETLGCAYVEISPDRLKPVPKAHED